MQNLIATTIADAQRLPSFALILSGDALAPDYLDGDLLTVATNIEPVPGDAVVALIAGSYRCAKMNADGDLWDNQGGGAEKGKYSIAGVVTHRTPKA
ncbi:MAG: S24 family peptidase [Armatimonadota bacterium]